MTGLRYAEQYGEVLWISVLLHHQAPRQGVDFGVQGKHGYQHVVINMERPPHTDECFICGHEWETSVDDTFHYRVCKQHTPHIKVSSHLHNTVLVEEIADTYSVHSTDEEDILQGACILTAENMHTEDDCSTHDHESDDIFGLLEEEEDIFGLGAIE